MRRVLKVAYDLEFPLEMNIIHLIFHLSMLKKFMGEPNSIVLLEDVNIEENMTYEEVPVKILDRRVKRLRDKEVAFIKVLWKN